MAAARSIGDGAHRVGTRSRAFLPCAVALLALLVLPAGAAAKNRPIKGKLSVPGYTVIALAADGEAKTDRAPSGEFKLRPPAGKVTLHLRAADGTYAGPIVVGKRKKGKRAILGVKAKKKVGLGKVEVKGEGYAKAKLRKASVDRKREATAKKGIPIGAGNFGRVRVRKLKTVPGDLDRDGIADSLDIDDDGDLVLDEFDPKPRKKGTRAVAATKAQGAQAGGIGIESWTDLQIAGDPVNANAPGVDDADIEAALPTDGRLNVSPGFPPPGGAYLSGELDCGELTYCSAGGTGEHEAFQFDPNPEPFPACCDPDGDGLGAFDRGPGGFLSLALQTNATSDQIRAGDVLIARTKTDAGQFELTTTLDDVFATVPAIDSYTDELGTTHEVSYPPPRNLPVVDGPDAGSDVQVTLKFWRPQRRSIPDEVPPGGAKWIDIGGLQYHAHGLGSNGVGGACPQASYSETDSNLSPGTAMAGMPFPALDDSAPDQPASSANTFTYTLNLSDCLASNGGTFNPGDPATFFFNSNVLSEGGHPTNLNASTFGFERLP